MHNLDSAAEELNLERWQVFRLVARGVLSAQTVGGGKLRFTKEAVESASRSDDLEGWPVFQGWIDGRTEDARAGTMAARIREVMTEMFDEEDPGQDRIVRYSGGIAAIGNAAPKPLMIRSDDRPWPYTSVKEIYVVSKLRMYVRREIYNKSVNDRTRIEGKRPKTELEYLYVNAEHYEELVGRAWRSFITGSINVRKSYPSPNRVRPVERLISLRHADIAGLSQPLLLTTAFDMPLATNQKVADKAKQVKKVADTEKQVKKVLPNRGFASKIRIVGRPENN